MREFSDFPDADEVVAGGAVVAAVAATGGQGTLAVRAGGSGTFSTGPCLEQDFRAEAAACGFHETLAVPSRRAAGLRAVYAPVFLLADILRRQRGRMVLPLLLPLLVLFASGRLVPMEDDATAHGGDARDDPTQRGATSGSGGSRDETGEGIKGRGVHDRHPVWWYGVFQATAGLSSLHQLREFVSAKAQTRARSIREQHGASERYQRPPWSPGDHSGTRT